jgi:ubiquinone/menaquinone biosynthesis C-methylase UbiE
MLKPGTMLCVGAGGDDVRPWTEGLELTVLDINPDCNPDIIADMCDMESVETGSFDYVQSVHSLEHLYPHDVDRALKEFLRVLKPGGTVMIFVPDLEGVETTLEPLYESPSGWICGLDMIYGKKSFIENSIYMSHHTGFVSDTLHQCLIDAGFMDVVTQRIANYNLFAGGKRPLIDKYT